MPLVSATDVPGGASLTGTLPQAPTQVPRDYQDIRAEPQSFGYLQGQALEKVGTTLETAAGRLADRAIEQQTLHNQISAHDAANGTQDTANKILYGDPNDPTSFGFYGLKGKGALDATPGVRQQLVKLYSDARNNLQNPHQQLIYDNEVRSALRFQLSDIGKHYDQQQQAWAKATADAGYDQGKQTAAANIDNPEGFAVGVQGMMTNALAELNRATGGAPNADQVNSTLAKVRADATVMHIDAMGHRDPAGALDVLHDPQNQALVLAHSPAQFYRLEGTLQHQADQQIGTDLGRRAMGQPPRGGGGAAPSRGEDPGEPGPNPQLATQRAPFANELKSNPALKKQLAALVDLENPQAGTAVVESLMNRMVKNGGTIASGIGGGDQSFYGPVRRGSVDARLAELERDPAKLATRMRQIDQALAGSNIVRGYTDQGSKNDPNYEAGGVGINIAGERFNYHGGDTPENRKWRETHQAGIGASGMQVAAATPTVTTDASAPPPTGPAAEVAADVAAGGTAPLAPPAAPVTTTAAPGAPAGAGPIPTGAPAAARLPAGGDVVVAGGPPPMESRETLLARIPPIGSVDPQTGRVVTAAQHDRAEAYVNGEYNKQNQRTEESRARLENDLKNGAQMLADGKEFSYDEAYIRSLLPPEKADPIIEGLSDAKTVGVAKTKIAGMTPQEIATERDRLNAEKAAGPTSGYIQRSKEAAAFAIASYQHYKDLDADPSLYVARNNPRIGALQAASGQSPQAFSDYAIASLTEQTRLGVPPERRHILGTSEAPARVNRIMADPENASMIMRQLAAQSGTSWDQVWRDLTTVGKMPPAFQAVGKLENEADAGILAKALGVGVKDEKSWDQILPQTARNDIRTAIDGSTEVSNLLRSLSQSGSSGTQVAGVKAAIEMLAYGKRFYHQDADAAAHAIKAFTDNYQFMPNGGGRVPSKVFDAVSSNAANTLFALEPGGIKIPEVLTSPTPIPGSANTDDYMRQLKANPTWITAPTGDALWLMDPQGRIVRYRDNAPVSVPFAGAMRSLPPSTPYSTGQAP